VLASGANRPLGIAARRAAIEATEQIEVVRGRRLM